MILACDCRATAMVLGEWVLWLHALGLETADANHSPSRPVNHRLHFTADVDKQAIREGPSIKSRISPAVNPIFKYIMH